MKKSLWPAITLMIPSASFCVKPFSMYRSTISFGLMNMILGVIVENTLQMQRNNEEKVKKMQEKQMNHVLGKLREVLESADADGSGSLTQEEFAEAIQNPEIANQLRLIDFPVEDPDEI